MQYVGVAISSRYKHHDSMPLPPSHAHSKASHYQVVLLFILRLTCDLQPIRKMLFSTSLPFTLFLSLSSSPHGPMHQTSMNQLTTSSTMCVGRVKHT